MSVKRDRELLEPSGLSRPLLYIEFVEAFDRWKSLSERHSGLGHAEKMTVAWDEVLEARQRLEGER